MEQQFHIFFFCFSFPALYYYLPLITMLALNHDKVYVLFYYLMMKILNLHYQLMLILLSRVCVMIYLMKQKK